MRRSLPDCRTSASALNAANICLACAILLLCCLLLSPVLHRQSDSFNRLLLVALGLVTLVTVPVGAAAGLVAILSARPGQRRVVITRATLGLVVFALIAAIAVPSFLRARRQAIQNKEDLQGVRMAEKELRHRTIAFLNGASRQPADFDRLQQSLEKAAANSSGDAAAVLRGTEAFLRQVRDHQQVYETASRELTEAKVLKTANLKHREEIQQRKHLVTEFLNANEDLRSFVTQSQVNYSNQLAGFQVSGPRREIAQKEFMNSFGQQLPVILEIRSADDRFGNLMLNVLDLLERNWGRWRYDERASVVRFQDRNLLEQYNALMAGIRQAGVEQVAAQKRLATIYAKASRS